MLCMSTAMIWQTVSTSSADTERLGELLGSLITPPAVIELRSDLGGGKTTFTRGLARGFGSTNIVSSPTFTLSKIYNNNKDEEIHHFDFYRLNEPGILTDQLAESLQDSMVITVVEWSDIIKHVLPNNHLTVELKPVADNPDARQIVVTYPEYVAGVIKQLETSWSIGKP